MVCEGISGSGGWTPVKLTTVKTEDGKTTYRTPDGVTIRVKNGQNINVLRDEQGQYHFDGVNNAEIFGSKNKDRMIFSNSENNTINVRNDGHGSDYVEFASGTKGNTVIGDKHDMTRDANSRYRNTQLHPSIFNYKQQ
jgi:hypothetical protein